MEGNPRVDLHEKTVFDEQQLEEIEAGRTAGLDVSVYAKPDYHALKMRQIRLGLEAGLDVAVYADAGYDWLQMEELRLGLEHGLDVGFYATTTLTGYQMRQLRKAKMQGHDLSAYRRLPAEVLRQVRKAKKSGVDLDPYLDKGYSAGLLEQIRLALENETDISAHLKTEYEPEALREIRLGIEAGLDISVYESTEYNWKQMRELRLGLMRRVDVSVYANTGYHWKQMRELRLGMESGVDVSCYESVKLSPLDMHRIRKEIVAQLTKDAETETAEGGIEREKDGNKASKTADAIIADIEQQLEEIQVADVENIADEVALSLKMAVRITEDGMNAYLKVPHIINRRYTVGELVKALMDYKVVYGLDQDAISQLIQDERYDEEVLVAQGTPAKNGQDGYYEFMFKTSIPTIPHLLQDGSVDYRNVQFFEYIKAGETVAVYHCATAGTPGYTVMGRVLPAKHGMEQQVLVGKHIHADKDNVTYVADANGKIELRDHEVIISDVLEVDEVNYSTGNIRFGGSVHIKGNVSTGMLVEAGEDIVINGNVEGATIRCGRNLLLKRGVLGGGACQIQAEGTVTGKFFENATIHAGGDIAGNYALNCNIYSGGQVKISGKRGVILGGSLHAVRGLSVQNAGNHAEVATYISLGVTKAMLEKRGELEKLLAKVETELSVFYKAKSQYEQKYDLELLKASALYMKIGQAIAIKDSELRKYTEERQRLLQDMQGLEGVKAQIRGEIFEGVTVAINGFVWQAKHARYLELHVEGDHIGLFTYDGKALESYT